MNRKPTRPKPTWPMRFSPQVWRNRWAERLSEVNGPVPSTTMTGTASQVTICQAMPMARTTIWPRKPARCWMVLRIKPDGAGEQGPQEDGAEPGAGDREGRAEGRVAAEQPLAGAGHQGGGEEGHHEGDEQVADDADDVGEGRGAVLALAGGRPWCCGPARRTRHRRTSSGHRHGGEEAHDRDGHQLLVALEHPPGRLGHGPAVRESPHGDDGTRSEWFPNMDRPAQLRSGGRCLQPVRRRRRRRPWSAGRSGSGRRSGRAGAVVRSEEPSAPLITSSWVVMRSRRSATWLTMPMVRPPARRPSMTSSTCCRVSSSRLPKPSSMNMVSIRDAAGLGADDVGHAERQGQRGEEALARPTGSRSRARSRSTRRRPAGPVRPCGARRGPRRCGRW